MEKQPKRCGNIISPQNIIFFNAFFSDRPTQFFPNFARYPTDQLGVALGILANICRNIRKTLLNVETIRV